jgi:hypothetical protein
MFKNNKGGICVGKNSKGTSSNSYLNMNPGTTLRLAVHMTRWPKNIKCP